MTDHPQQHAIQGILAECLMIPASDIRLEDHIDRLKNMDSLSFEMVIVAMETESGKTIEPMRLMTLKTVHDLADLLGQLKA